MTKLNSKQDGTQHNMLFGRLQSSGVTVARLIIIFRWQLDISIAILVFLLSKTF